MSELRTKNAKSITCTVNGGVRRRLLDKLNETYSPLDFGAVGDGIADDRTPFLNMISAIPQDAIVDMQGKSFLFSSSVSFSKRLTFQNGHFIASGDRVGIVTASGVKFDSTSFSRSGVAGANEDAVVVDAADVEFRHVSCVSNTGNGLRFANGSCDGSKVFGGYYESSSSDGAAIRLDSGVSHNYDISIEGAKIRHTGYGSGIVLFNCSRCTVRKCDIRAIRRSPLVTMTGWELVSGTAYRTLDRTDIESNAVYVNGTEYTKNSPDTATEPSVGYYTVVGDYLHINTGADPTTDTVQTTRTNGYGILFYASTSEAIGMSDNLAEGNYIEDVDGFGIYFQTLQNVPKNNRTLRNTLRDVCLEGVTVDNLPFAGIGVFGGRNVSLIGDHIDTVGAVGKEAPGIDFKASGDCPNISASISSVVVENATSHGLSISPGEYVISGSRFSNNGGTGIVNGTLTTGDTLDVVVAGCIASDNTESGINFAASGTGIIRPKIIDGIYHSNTFRNIALGRTEDVYISDVLSYSGGNYGITLSSSIKRVVIDGLHLLAGSGLSVPSGIADVTIKNVVNDGSAGTKLNISGPYKIGGSTSGTTQWVTTGTPESVISANVGSTCVRSDGGTGTTLYVKESGTGNTGWVAK